LTEVKKIRPTDVADLNKKEGAIYDIAEAIADLCTITEKDVRDGISGHKNLICSKVPKFALGNYKGDELNNESADHYGDMSDIGCTNLPLVGDKRYFVFGVLLPEVEVANFGGCEFCYAQGLNPKSGTGMMLMAPKCIFDNPLIKVAMPGLADAAGKASQLISYVAVGVSFPPSGQPPQMEVELSANFWRCSGTPASPDCKTVKANVFASIALDLTDYASKKINLGPLSLAFEAKCLMNFDPNDDGYMNKVNTVPILGGLINGKSGGRSGLEDLIDPTKALDFLMGVMKSDFLIAIDGKLTVSVPLSDWSNGLFGDLEMTIGSASAMFRKGNVCEDIKTEGTVLEHGDKIRLQQPEHGTYLGMCGNRPGCGGSHFGVYGYSSNTQERTIWHVEKHGNDIYLRQNGHGAYIGLCGHEGGCDGSKHGVYGYKSRIGRCRWRAEILNGNLYLKQPDHGTYLGMCGGASNCDSGIRHGVKAWSETKGRTQWLVEKTNTKRVCHPETGVWVSIQAGGLKSDVGKQIQQNILDNIQTKEIRAVVGILGKGIGAVVDAILSVGMGFDMYMKGHCSFSSLNGACSNFEFGVKFWASEFEAYIERRPSGKFAFCFAIKKFWNSCGGGWENILMLLKAVGEVLVKVGKIIAAFVEDTFNNCVKEVAELAENALKHGKIVIDAVGKGFENGAKAAVDWAGGAADSAVTWGKGAVNDAGEWTVGAFNDAGNWVSGAASDTVNAVGNFFKKPFR